MMHGDDRVGNCRRAWRDRNDEKGQEYRGKRYEVNHFAIRVISVMNWCKLNTTQLPPGNRAEGALFVCMRLWASFIVGYES